MPFSPQLEVPTHATSIPAHLLHHSYDACDERVRILVLPGAGVQVHASLFKHHLVKAKGLGRSFSQGRGLEALTDKLRWGVASHQSRLALRMGVRFSRGWG